MIAEQELTTQHYKKLVEVFGSKNLINKIESPFDFIHCANEGIEASVINNFIVYFKLSKTQTADMLNVSEPTLYRWTKANKNLDRNFSVKLFEIADLFLYGEEVFGNRNAFFNWLNLPNTALGGLHPIELIEIPGGVSKVKDILGRIEYGVYS
jgi:putative toxin-antitoxin system antitoxin component (TIGR02293 family)